MQQNIISIMPIVDTPTKVRVAAYVRVSTNKEDQLNSFAAQYIHYKKMFENSSYEELIDVYSDEGISGTTSDKRDNFNRMLEDCEKGRIQKIYVKSVSRFGRNTAESLAHIRYLKTLGIGEHEYYYIEESHQPIITKTVFDCAQKLRVSRVPKCITSTSEHSPFSGAIHCEECGKVFRVVNRKNSVQWACRTHHKNVADCPTMCIPEAEVVRAFIAMYNKIKANRKAIITPIISQLVTLKNRISTQSVEFTELDRKIMLINDQLALMAELKQKQLIDEETFRRKSNELNNSMSSLRSKRRLFLNNSQADVAIADMKRLASVIDKGPDRIDAFTEELFESLVEDIMVGTSDEIKFKLIGGLVLKEAIERTHR